MVWGLVPAVLAPLLCAVIRANGDKERTKGCGSAGGGRAEEAILSQRVTFSGQIKKGKGELLGSVGGS